MQQTQGRHMINQIKNCLLCIFVLLQLNDSLKVHIGTRIHTIYTVQPTHGYKHLHTHRPPPQTSMLTDTIRTNDLQYHHVVQPTISLLSSIVICLVNKISDLYLYCLGFAFIPHQQQFVLNTLSFKPHLKDIMLTPEL